MVSETDLRHLRRCVELAAEALDAGDEPFGSVLVSAGGAVLAEDRNRAAGGDRTRHPEFELARWAAANLTPEERAAATVYTSGEHCPMCAAAHGWVGLNAIYLADFGWYRVDPRGNKPGVDAQFLPPEEKLAFGSEDGLVADVAGVFATSLAVVVESLRKHSEFRELVDVLPDLVAIEGEVLV